MINDFKNLKQKIYNLIYIVLPNVSYCFSLIKKRNARNKKSKINALTIVTMITIKIMIIILKNFNNRIIELTFIL